jgi:hypothetical protein
LLRHHFVRGRGFGRILRDRDGFERRDLLGGMGRQLLWQTTGWRLKTTTDNVRRWGDAVIKAKYRRAFPLVVAGTLSAAAGTWYEILRSSPGHLAFAAAFASSDQVVDRDGCHDEGHALLPRHRIVAYYGHPSSPNMGIVGERDRESMLAELREVVAQYAAADPHRPVIPAIELVAVMATRTPGSDGNYRTRMSARLLDEWSDFIAQEGGLLILDVQPGRSSCREEIATLQRWLRLPHVHLALDPEWAMDRDAIPGGEVGTLSADEIRAAQDTLASIVAADQLPPKLLIVHQFQLPMIAGKESLTPVRGVQLVIDVDGHGDPILKTTKYQALVCDRRTGFAGIKLFYRQDTDLMSPEEVLALEPPPDLVVYQ